MNSSVYVFGVLGGGYTQYPDDYAHEIFKEFLNKSQSQSQIIIHRKKSIMYYGYVRKLDVEEMYLGLCVLLNDVMLGNMETLFSLFERVFSEMVSKCEIIKLDGSGNIIPATEKLNEKKQEVEYVMDTLHEEVAHFEGVVSKLPPIDYSMAKDSCKSCKYTDKNETLVADSVKYAYTYIRKDDQYDTPLLTGLKNVLRKQQELNNGTRNFTRNNASIQQNKYMGILGLFLLIVVTGIIVFFVKGKNQDFSEGENAQGIGNRAYGSSQNDLQENQNNPFMQEDENNTNEEGYNSSPNRDLTFNVGDVSFCLKYVEGGTFKMGATDEQREYAEKEEFPAHTVTLHDYYIGETEVTQELWEEVMGYNPANTIGASLPIENVSWNDCIDFIRELNRQTGKTFRLPTEAEWEYAAKGGVSSCQYLYSGSDIAEEVGWIKSNCGGRTHPVGTRNPNELGIYDMTGNVCEWCQDWMSDYSSTSFVNPTGPRDGTARVGRGGGWCNSSARNRVSTRFAGKTTYRDYNLGFRIAM